ncbi:response regulator transcription factor [Simiduia aestuariiviva]|uniref:DNA-binding NarL/FixJ family response regulator n=1 Tax=Simiduia aestuariiviva TaxID=1510459 RepID=A0A839UNW8_9GAMM|nr:response regulator transcription factor [Simiduia aestuariiviva]MBB3169884.1 DNA-binding NarL/FixJ family response regulator [Simiduia aestuariiviva]
MNLKILIADDHQMVSDGLAALIDAQSGMSVIGCATNGVDALAKAKQLRPDVVVMDVSMPEMNGIEATQEIHNRLPTIRIIMLSMHSSPEYIHRALQAGAMGYILKRSAGKEVVKAIEQVTAGKHFFSEAVAEIVVEQSLHRPAGVDAVSLLSARERQVLQLLAESHSIVRIAELLSLSPKTIETYRARIYEKLALRDLPQLVRFALKHGLTSLD